MTIVHLNNKQSGQGLIETLIAMLLIFITVASLISFESNLAYHDSLIAQQNDATLLAANEIEVLRDYLTLATYTARASGATTSVGLSTTFTVTWTIASFTAPTYDTINVVVTWTDRRGVAQSITLSSRMAGIDPTNSSSIM